MPVNQSQVKVDSIESVDAGPVIVSYGASVPSGQRFVAQGSINIAGVVTASNFIGNGSGLTGIPIASQGQAIALTFIT